MDGQQPARVPAAVIAEIRSRENRAVELLPKPAGFHAGDRVRVITGPFAGQLALFHGMRPHERVLVLLPLLGGEQRVELARTPIDSDHSVILVDACSAIALAHEHDFAVLPHAAPTALDVAAVSLRLKDGPQSQVVHYQMFSHG
jgi:hypothetical protein